jgi:acetyl esterase/lipase
MKKTLLSTFVLFLAMTATAQPAGGFGGFQQQVKLETSQEWKDVNYAGDDKAFHTCDIYLPKEVKDSYPVVIHIYGSAWFSNNSKGAADLGTIVKALLDAGYAVVCPNHRSSMDAKWPAQLHDIRAVIRFVRGEAKKYKFDTSFIATSGFSSGGHLASTAATTSGTKQTKVGTVDIDLEGSVGNYTSESSAVNAACDWSGPIDLTAMDCGDHMTMGDNSPEDVLLGSKLSKEPDKYLSLSAVSYVDKNDPPVIIFHGEKDNVVPCCQGRKFFEVLKAAGVKTEATFVPEGGHGMGMYSEENLHKMVCFLNAARGGECCKGGGHGCCKEEAKTRVIEDGGTGDYKAIMKEEPTLKEHTVIVPQDLTPFSATKPLPVLVWGNGACANSPFEHINFLNEIASHGYIVLATGNIPMTDEWYKGPMSRSEQQIESIDWIIAQNADPKSPYYQKVDVKNICVAGMSCGGLQTLYNCADPRIKTLMICNSGLFNQQNAGQAVGGMPMPSKDKLKEIHTPIIYILGGETDIAYGNGMDDFHRISHVPACATNFPVGHGGTYRQPHGGEFTVVALAWLDWQLKSDQQAAKMFIGKNCDLSKRKDWTIEKNKLFSKLKK